MLRAITVRLVYPVALLALILSAMPQCRAGDIHTIDQITDLSALTPEQFYRFEPNLLYLKPGDTLRFLNSLGNHTVKSVPGIWPSGVTKVDISHKPQYDIVLNTPGVYGFKCKVHNRHGMFALIIVGDVDPDLSQWKSARLNDVGKRVFRNLYARLEQKMKRSKATK